MTIVIEPATVADAGAMAILHVQVWRETYRGVVPEAAWLALDESQREASWRRRLSAPAPGQAAFVARDGERIVGIIAAGPPSQPLFGRRGEIGALYVDASLHRQGIGRRLLQAAAQHLAAEGFAGLALGVVASNEPAIAFYTALGGRIAGAYQDPGPLWRSDNLAIVWDELISFA